MLFKTTIFSIIGLLAANGAAAPVEGSGNASSSILIATDPYYACNCPNNCDHHEGSSCKFYSGPSDTDSVTSGTCEYPNGSPSTSLECIA